MADLDDTAVFHRHHPVGEGDYLFALVAGNLGRLADSFVTLSGRTVELGIYVEPGKETLAAMRWTP